MRSVTRKVVHLARAQNLVDGGRISVFSKHGAGAAVLGNRVHDRAGAPLSPGGVGARSVRK
jgi:hypothetical protein